MNEYKDQDPGAKDSHKLKGSAGTPQSADCKEGENPNASRPPKKLGSEPGAEGSN